jgi:hypothetical protein
MKSTAAPSSAAEGVLGLAFAGDDRRRLERLTDGRSVDVRVDDGVADDENAFLGEGFEELGYGHLVECPTGSTTFRVRRFLDSLTSFARSE